MSASSNTNNCRSRLHRRCGPERYRKVDPMRALFLCSLTARQSWWPGPELIAPRRFSIPLPGSGQPDRRFAQPVGGLRLGGHPDVMSSAFCEGKTYAVVRSGGFSCDGGDAVDGARTAGRRVAATARRRQMLLRRLMRARTSAQATK